MTCCGGDEPNKVGAAGEPDGGKFGQPKAFDAAFRGPVDRRSCTDVLCLLLFILFIAAQVIVCGFAFANGDPRRLIAPVDSAGRMCGYGSMSARPHLFLFDLAACGRLSPAVLTGQGCPTPKVCLASCPKDTWFFLEASATEAAGASSNGSARRPMVCVVGVDPLTSSLTVTELVRRQLCAPYVLPSRPVAHRCVPEALLQALDLGKTLTTAGGRAIASADNSTVLGKLLREGAAVFKAVEIGQKVFDDVVRSAWFLLVGYLLAVLTAFVWIVLLRFFTGCMVWVTLLSLQLVLLVASSMCFYKAVVVAQKSFKTDNWQFQVSRARRA